MRLRLLLTLLLVAGGPVFVVGGLAQACTCGAPLPFAKAVKEADAVFAGVVTSLEQTSGERAFLGSTPYGNFAYTFTVDEVVAGEVGPTIEVNAHSSGASCGLKFQKAARYIVFAYEGRGRLETNMCSRTERVNQTVAFGGKAPLGETRAETSADAETDAGPQLVLVGVAAIIGAGALLVLLGLRRR
ncbi:MAG: hypothetical protein ACRDJT_11935 [Actinomycetota bacterium]